MSKTKTTTKTMRGWAIDSYGGPERMRLMNLPVPKVGPRDVLMRMRGGEVGDWDILVAEGGWPMGRPFPLVLGLAGAGTAAEVGDGSMAWVDWSRTADEQVDFLSPQLSSRT